jgi:hypothetical protein
MRDKSGKERSLQKIQFSLRKNEIMKLFTLMAVIVFLSACSNNIKSDRNSQLEGMYKLFIIEIRDSSGVWHEQEWGKGGDGYIVYDGKGHMAVQITPKGYKDFKWLEEEPSINSDEVRKKTDSMTMDELKAAVQEFESSYVYFGNYSVDDTTDVVTHYRISSSIPAIWGTNVKRKFLFRGDTVILEPLNANRRLKWVKMK